MKKRFGLLLAAGLCALPGWAEPLLKITGSLGAQGELLMRYEPPPGVRELPFWPPTPHGQRGWRQKMARAADACTELTPSALRLKPGCRAATLKVTPRMLAEYATYEPAQPQSDGSGVLLHSGHYAVLLPGTALRWRWRAPMVLQRGAAHATSATLAVPAAAVDAELQASGDEHQRRAGLAEYVFLGRRPAQNLGSVWLVLDGALDAARASAVRERLRGSVQAYTQAYSQALPASGALVVTLSDLPGFHGDTTHGRMMRLRLPSDAGTMSAEDLALFVAHEAGHWWNRGLFRSDVERPWLHEGHAEWLAFMQQAQAGLLAPERLRERVEGYLNGCLAARGERPAASLPTGRRGQEDYACGLSLMQLAQAAHAQRQPAPQPPLRRLASLHEGAARLDVARLVDWADGPDGAWLRRLLQDPQQPFASGFVHAMQDLGLADPRPVAGSADLDPGLRQRQAMDLMSRVMAADCGGTSSFWGLADGAQLDADVSCQSLRVGQRVRGLQGQALMGQPVEAWDAVHAACARGEPIRVDYTDGPSSQQTCPKDFPPRALRTLLKLRPEALQRWGFPAG